MNEAWHRKVNEDKWDRWARVADGKGLKFRFLRKCQVHAIKIADPRPGISFLDIGCGTGWAVGFAAKISDYNGIFYGIDMSEEMIKKAMVNFKEHGNIRFLRASSESIPIENNFFDTIICTNSFHHYLKPDLAMAEIARLLKPGGKVFILDLAADSLVIKIIDKLMKLLEPSHVKLYSSKEFGDMMAAAGLKYLGYNSPAKLFRVQMGRNE